MNRPRYQPPSRQHLPGGAGRIILWLLLLVTQPVPAGSPDILIISSSDSSLYQQFQAAFRTTHAQSGHPDDTVISRTVYLENGEIDENLIHAETGLLITIGSRAARAVAGMELAVPVINTLIPESVYRSITRTHACSQQSAIFIDQPISRQARLAGLLYPQRDKYGLLLGPVSVHRRPEIEALQQASERQLIVREVGKDGSTMATGRKLISEAELFVAVNDPRVLNRVNAKWLLYVSYQHRLPVIGFSNAYVKAGAAAAVFSEPEQLARQAAELVLAWRDSGKQCLPAPEYPRYFKVAVNHAVNDSLGGMTLDEKTLARKILEQEQQ